MQNNHHVKHTDAHTKHNLTGIIPINIRPEHKTVQEVYITTRSLHNNTHTKSKNMKPHLMKILNIRQDERNLKVVFNLARKGPRHVFLQDKSFQRGCQRNDHSTSRQQTKHQGFKRKRKTETDHSEVRIQEVKDHLFEKVYIVMLFSI